MVFGGHNLRVSEFGITDFDAFPIPPQILPLRTAIVRHTFWCYFCPTQCRILVEKCSDTLLILNLTLVSKQIYIYDTVFTLLSRPNSAAIEKRSAKRLSAGGESLD